MQFTKLSALVGKTFTIQSISSYTWIKWDNEQNKMLKSDTYVEGYKKKWPVLTDKGQLDVGKYQLSDILVNSLINGVSNPIGKTFSVKSNGKTGMDIRYFINLSKASDLPSTPPQPLSNERKLQTATPEPPPEDLEIPF